MIAAVKPRSLGFTHERAPSRAFLRTVILFLHNRYRTQGGEERAVADLAWLVREHLGEPVERLERDSCTLGGAAAARGLLAALGAVAIVEEEDHGAQRAAQKTRTRASNLDSGA